MPYCPDCFSEYREGVERCSDCGAELLPGSPPEADNEAVPLVRLCSRSDPNEAEVIQANLAESGILAVVRRHGPISGELGRVTDGMTEDYAIVMVPEDQVDEAQKILEALEKGDFDWPEGMEPDEEDD